MALWLQNSLQSRWIAVEAVSDASTEKNNLSIAYEYIIWRSVFNV
jgi:hypothetical protein